MRVESAGGAAVATRTFLDVGGKGPVYLWWEEGAQGPVSGDP
jgi:hypothetical protein